MEEDFTIDTIKNRTGENTQSQTGKVVMGKYTLFLDSPKGTWNPTTNGIVFGELLAKEDFSGQTVLELGTGVGLHAIIIAAQGAKHITVTEIDQEILDVAKANIEKYRKELKFDTEFEYIVADWTDLPNKEAKYDAIVTNPPFAVSVRDHKKAHLHWFLDSYINDAKQFLKPSGNFFCIHTSMADFHKTEEKLLAQNMSVAAMHARQAPFRDYYFQDPEQDPSRYFEYIKKLPKYCFSIAVGEKPQTTLQQKYCDWQHYELVIAFKAILRK